MNWVEYKLENDSVIKVPYNRCNVAPITQETLEQLIKVVNASMRQAKILEHIKTNYADRMRKQYEQGRADQKEEDNAFFNFEGAWELEKKKARADAINDYVKILVTEFDFVDTDIQRFIEIGESIKYKENK